MPAADEVKSSWADEVEEEGTVCALPPPTEEMNINIMMMIKRSRWSEHSK
jgi:hypothetical protein